MRHYFFCFALTLYPSCKKLKNSCLSSSESALVSGSAPFASEVLQFRNETKFQLVSTNAKDDSGAVLGFLAGSINGGLIWVNDVGERFVISGSTYIKVPSSQNALYQEYKVNSAGDLVPTEISYSREDFLARPIVRPLLRMPPRSSNSHFE